MNFLPNTLRTVIERMHLSGFGTQHDAVNASAQELPKGIAATSSALANCYGGIFSFKLDDKHKSYLFKGFTATPFDQDTYNLLNLSRVINWLI